MAITRRHLLRAGTTAGIAAALPMSHVFEGMARAVSSPTLGEIMLFAGNFAPAGWARCDGQLLPISENDALFTLIGTTYGGDGQSTFALPNIQSRFPVHQGPGYTLGQAGGVESVTLTTNQIPVHTHVPLANNAVSTQSGPDNAVWGVGTTARNYASGAPNALMNQQVAPAGGNQPHENMMPFVVMTYCISLFGIFPQFS